MRVEHTLTYTMVYLVYCISMSDANIADLKVYHILGHPVYNCIPRTKYVRGILWFSRRYAAASASAASASADTSSFSR